MSGPARTALFFAALTLLVPTDTVAGQQPTRLDGFVVTAHRTPRAAWTISSNATVIEGADLERSGVTYVADALRQLPGLEIVRGGSFGATTSLFLRGGESDYVQVLVDGVPMNQPGGAFDLGGLTTENVERIEVIRGPASSLYGSDAVSGVVQIFTKRGGGPASGHLSVSTGSFGTRDYQAAVSGGEGLLSYAFSLRRNRTDGALSFNNAHDNTVFSGRVAVAPDPATDAALSVRYQDRAFHFPTDGSGNLVDTNAFTFGDALAVSLDGGRRWLPQLETRVTLTVHESDTGTDDAVDGPDDNTGFFAFQSLDDTRRTTADIRTRWNWTESGALTAGFEFEEQSVRTFNESASEFGISSGWSDNERSNRAFYGQLWHTEGPVSVDAGVRLEDNQRFGTSTTWRLGSAWRTGDRGPRLRASVGTAIKEPTFFENFATGFVVGNPDLSPERSRSWEVGADQGLWSNRVQLAATYFDQEFEDLIQYVFPALTEGGPNYTNVARATSRGAEAEVSVDLGMGMLRGWYHYLDTEVEDAGFDEGPGAAFVQGEPLLRRPAHTLGLTGTISLSDRWAAEATLRRTGERSDRDFGSFPAVPVVLDAYTTIDLAARTSLIESAAGRPGVDLTVRLENLLDESFEEVWGFPAPGRGLYVGGAVRFGR